jgi:cytochrome P450
MQLIRDPMRIKPAGVPVYTPDIYSVDAIVDPYPHYQRLRDLGAVVWLAKQNVYALPRYAECKTVLRDDKTFLSGWGVALNPITNRPVPRHDAQQRWRRTRPATQTSRPPDVAARTARNQRQRGRDGRRGRRHRAQQWRD